MKTADISRMEYFEGSGTDTPSADDALGPPRRHPPKKGHSASAVDRVQTSKKRKPRKNDVKATVYY